MDIRKCRISRISQRFTGFTLVELIVVISILAILATVGFISLTGYSGDAKKSALATNVRTVYSAISTESALTGNSPRYYVVHDTGAALSSGVVFVDGSSLSLSGWDWNVAGTNYTAGNPNYPRLKLNPEKFRISRSDSLIHLALAAYDSGSVTVGTVSATTTSGAKPRQVSFTQAAAVADDGTATVVGDYAPASTGAVAGLVDDPLSSSASGALVDGSLAWSSGTPTCNPSESVVSKTCKDPYFSNVLTLAHFDSDLSAAKWAPYYSVGNAAVSPSSAYFGGGGLVFDGAWDSAQTLIPTADMNLWTGAVTIEGWFKVLGTGQQALFGQWNFARWPVAYFNAGSVFFGYFDAGWNERTTSYVSKLADKNWHHVAYVRESGSNQIKMYEDGTLMKTYDMPHVDYVLWNTDGGPWNFRLGSDNNGTPWRVLSGSVDEFRLTKGVARYTSNFPAPTQAFANQ